MHAKFEKDTPNGVDFRGSVIFLCGQTDRQTDRAQYATDPSIPGYKNTDQVKQ